MYDCLIVGGGPAGLTAALYLARFKLHCTVVDAGAGRALRIPRSHNFPGFPNGISGTDLLAKMRTQLAQYQIFPTAGHIEKVAYDGTVFRAELGGKTVAARTVLLATGVEDVRPVFATDRGHDDALQLGVLHYCPVCDGFEVSDKDVVVLGSGAHGAKEAMFVRSFTPRVTLICPDGPHRLSDHDVHQLAESNVKLDDGPITPLRFMDDHIVFSSAAKNYHSPAVYAALGCRPHTQLATNLGITLSEEGVVIVDAHQRTSHPLVYAAGDVVRGLDQIATAIGQAAVAALTIRNDLSARANS